MQPAGTGDAILTLSRWTVAGRSAFTKVTRAEAMRLSETARLRCDVEHLLLGMRASRPAVESLVMYVLDGEQVVGFAELVIEPDGLRWHGPHVAGEAGGTQLVTTRI